MNNLLVNQRLLHKSFLLVLLLICCYKMPVKAQQLSKLMGATTWYSKQQPGDSVVVLQKDVKLGGPREWRLGANERSYFKTSAKSKIDSSYYYSSDKKNLSFYFKLKDSVKLFRYELHKKSGQSLSLRLNYSFIYRYKKGNDTVVMPELTVSRGKQIKTILSGEDITVFVQKRGRRNDSIDMAIWGQFVGLVKDTILVDSDQFVEHNFYKKYTDSLHYYSPLLIDTIIRMKIPIKYITGIYKEREPFGMYMTRTTIAGMSVGLGFMMASLFSGTDSDIGNTHATIATAAFLTVPVSFGLGVSFSKLKFRIKGGKQPEKLWKIERHMPRPQIKIYKKGKRII